MPLQIPTSLVIQTSRPTLVVSFLAAVLSWKILSAHLRASSRRKRMPPGPKGQWLLGTTKDMLDPSMKPWFRFEEWSREHKAEHLLSVPTIGLTDIIVNSMQAAHEMLDKKPSIYSKRPRMIFDAEIVEQNMVLANLSDPDAVQRRRKLLNEDMGREGAKNVQFIQQEEARKLAADLLKRPTEYLDVIKWAQHNLVTRITCSTTSTITPKQLWAHIEGFEHRPRPALVPFLAIWPSLRFLPSWIPGADFYGIGHKYFQEDKKVWSSIVNDVRAEMAAGRAPHSFVANWLQTDAASRYGFSETEIAFAAGNLLTAGGDLPDVTLRIFILTMLHFKDVARKAQAEIDNLVGRERAPTFDDQKDLPYTRAMILEIQRWRPLTPIGVSHLSTEDDDFQGMLIPKGTRMFPSLWAMSNDTTVYPEPQSFRPERHLRSDGTFTKSNELPTWGFGGRKCSAYLMAENTLFINIATLLWAFDFVAPKDEQGEEILPSTDYADWTGIIPCCPPEFVVTAIPRGPEVESLLRSEMDAA